MLSLEEYFEGFDESRSLFDVLYKLVETFGAMEVRVSKSQVSLLRRKTFARIWVPGRYLKSRVAPLVLTLSFKQKVESNRWKEIIEPTQGQFTHHLEIWSEQDIDEKIIAWLRASYEDAE